MSHYESSELEHAEARALLARALGEEPQMTNEPETVLASARRSLLRGRVLLTTGVMAGVLTVGFGATALAGGFGGGENVQPAGVSEPAVQPAPARPCRVDSLLECPPGPMGTLQPAGPIGPNLVSPGTTPPPVGSTRPGSIFVPTSPPPPGTTRPTSMGETTRPTSMPETTRATTSAPTTTMGK